MELIRKHISSCLHLFVNEKSSTFDNNFSEIQNDLKADYIRLIRYLDNLLNKTFSSTNEAITALHIHIEDEFTDLQKLLIAEFLLIKTFRLYQSTEDVSNQINTELNELIAELETRQKGLEIRCPEGASGKNGGNRIWRNWVKGKKDNRSLLKFYKSLNENSSLKPKLIFNTQKNFSRSVSQIFEYKPLCVLLDSKNKSYNLLNAINTLSEIDSINKKNVDGLDAVILFDCERKSLMPNFSFQEINKWNSDYDTGFKKYLIVTFGKECQSINRIRNKIDTIRERFKIPINSTYTILASEIDALFKRNEKFRTSIEFVGFETSSFWDTFIVETSIRELYELRCIKLMNVYSICLSNEIKMYIIDELFSENDSSELISSNTKMAILELRDENINILKEALSNLLDIIINSEIKSKISEKLINETTVILDETIIKNSKLVLKLKNALQINTLQFKSWSDLTNCLFDTFLILSYRDQGKFPSYYYPNLLEFEYEGHSRGEAILHNFLFGNHYKWSRFIVLKEYHKYLSHPIREIDFEWNKLKRTIQEQKPEAILDINWNLENEFLTFDNRETLKIKISNQKAKTYHTSDLMIYSEKNAKKPRIERIKWIYENLDFDEIRYDIQKLEELLDDFNPAERLIDTTQQESDLEVIRTQLGLKNETAGRIWKILLKNKSQIVGIEALYEELRLIFDKNKIPLVSINHFRNSWINIDSDSLMPRGNKVFKLLCDYLELNNNYRLILYRLKNASISGKIEATKKYSNLLKDLFADGCFDNNASIQTILQNRIQYYRNNHSLDELGIDNEYPINGLMILIELIQPELKLLELETIEKIEQ